MGTGEITFDDNGLQNWFEDPYDGTVKEGTPMNKSEQEQYDTEFSQHPFNCSIFDYISNLRNKI